MRSILKVLMLALAVTIAGLSVLGWQYRQLEKKVIPSLEDSIEQIAAKDVLDKFMRLRLQKDEAGAVRYLSERAIAEKEGGQFSLFPEFKDYEILNTEKLADDQYRFTVKLYDRRESQLEVIILIKILEKYYIDSMAIAG